ncbi:hypothetical protein PFAG_02215 [Plasmodium falciparum Santa Lucia]|uniref:Uncharacterized protein n=2 Tax=Plasmodium falciparum TaxID=5833 RepID=W4ISC2_PLAFP|nr:hypothetical protein PFUGPA_05349 [Plasmodium falciparum Palo Alto/Uganda]EUT87392.1 hypothetical protein PFAG_02215 [Plasmodium falciparum Santa Lucia]
MLIHFFNLIYGNLYILRCIKFTINLMSSNLILGLSISINIFYDLPTFTYNKGNISKCMNKIISLCEVKG